MINEELPSFFAVEAADIDTDPTRLADLALYPQLAPLVAANPAANTQTLMYLYSLKLSVIRRALAQNPGAPMPLLYQLAREFPAEFLQNSLLPMLNLAQPQFFQEIPYLSWCGILRCERIVPFWLKQIKADQQYQRRNEPIWSIIQLHVSIAGNAPETWRRQAGNALQHYQKNLPDSAPISIEEDFTLFLLSILLMPQAAGMFKEQWQRFAATATLSDEMHLALSSGVGISSRCLALLGRQRSIHVRSQVGRHTLTSPKTLTRLSRHLETSVRAAVAGNSHLPLKELEVLAAQTQASIRRKVATHPAVSEEDVVSLALDKDHSVRVAVATRHRLAQDVYVLLVSDATYQVRKALASNTQIPHELLLQLASDGEPRVRAAAASNPRLPREAIEHLLVDESEGVRICLAGNAGLPVAAAERLLQTSSTTVRKALAANPRTPAVLLDVLLATGEQEIWEGLACHPGLSPMQLTYLAEHGDLLVRSLVARHKRTPLAILQRLCEEHEKSIYSSLTSNPHVSMEILEQIVETEDKELWFRVLKHPVMLELQSGPFILLFKRKIRSVLVENSLPHWLRRVIIQYYTALPATIIEVFAESVFWEDRYLVARHPQVSKEIRQLLAHDGNCYVRMAAQVALEQARIMQEKRENL